MKSRLVSIGVLLTSLTPQLYAEDTPEVEPEEKIIVTGTRTSGRSLNQSSSPVDLLEGDDLVNQGDGDLTSIMRTLVPSYNVTTQAISDAGTVVRPANLRGLPPDSTLVLVNGKRRHRSAVISFLGQGVSDGAQGADLSMIPAIAVERAEVLKDGASALYGSDAIAGVMNFMLKEYDSGIQFEAKVGSYYEGDGELFQYSGNVGAPLFSGGFANISFELKESGATSRSVQRDDAATLIEAGNTSVKDPAQTWGQPEIRDDVKIFANFGQEINDSMEIYAFGNYGSRTTEGGFYFRNPTNRSGVYSNDGGATALIGDKDPTNNLSCQGLSLSDVTDNSSAIGQECFFFGEMFPGGFTPSFGGKLIDSSAVAGLRGDLANGFRYDISAGTGRSQIDFFINNTVNATLGPDSPNEFEPGGYVQEEEQFNVDLAYPVKTSLFASDLNIAFGAERRREVFTINAGNEASYEVGPYASQGFSIGSNGFAGFSKDIEGTFSRYNNAMYLDMETDITTNLLVGAALRWEDFEDFGVTQNGRITSRLAVSDDLAFRATYSTGFRAPTPGQANVTNTTTSFEGGELINRGTIPPTNPIAILKGGKQLKPETSENYTFGFLKSFGALRTSLDYFQFNVEDRIAQSASQSLTQDEANQLEADGYSGASDFAAFRFYTNGFSTKTYGVDLVMSLPFKLAGGQSLLTLAGNQTVTKVTSYEAGVLNETRIKQLEGGLPDYRANVSLSHRSGDWRALGRVNFFGSYYEAHLDDSTMPIKGGKEFTVDAELGYSVNNNFTLVLGAQNLFNEYPDDNPYRGIAGAAYPENSPMGFGGGFYYSKLIYVL